MLYTWYGMEGVDLKVRFRKIERHVPTVLSTREVFALIETLVAYSSCVARDLSGVGLYNVSDRSGL